VKPRKATIVPDRAEIYLAPGLQVAWDDLDAIRSDLGSDESPPLWRLQGDLSASHAAVRVLTGATRKGALLLLAGARPEGAGGHDAESPQAVIVSRSGEVEKIEEALLSTQYAADGTIERIGLELYGEEEDYPVRGAGDATSTSAADEGPIRRERALLEFRLDGEAGTAILDILHA
jgi:hypothetical protein